MLADEEDFYDTYTEVATRLAVDFKRRLGPLARIIDNEIDSFCMNDVLSAMYRVAEDMENKRLKDQL